MTSNYYPDGLDVEAITALQREVNDELRQQGYPVAPGERPRPRRSPRPTTEPTELPLSSASPQQSPDHDSDGTGSAADNKPDTAQPAGDTGTLLFTPAQAAAMLHVPESWLRRRAARHEVPRTVLGKHLRFSHADLDKIVADAARPADTARPTGPRTGPGPRRPGRPRRRARSPSYRPDA